jgi:hypothetical protein
MQAESDTRVSDKESVYPASTTGGDQRAVARLTEILKADTSLTKQKAKERLQIEGLSFSGLRFENHIWPEARERAGLPRKAPAGRRPNQQP